MVMFNEKDQLRKYDTVDSIVNNFCRVRFDYYVKRKQHQLQALEAEMRYLGNKERFVQEVIAEEIIVMNEKESDIIAELTNREYDEDPKKEDGGYDYLLRMQVRTFTADKVQQIANDIISHQKKLDELQSTSEKTIWLNELEEFEVAYKKWLVDIDKEVIKTKKKRGKK
jgi:DNA topoisomerase-2